ncbi:MAG TPA: hypothetical protein PKY82_13285 [Pyrinomonadaceae bacterium]|nr:hypothetical protein [Pyrinomonadaceae bacterium]
MYKLALLFLVIFICVSFAVAQEDYHKFEVAGGYSYERVKGFPGDTLTSTSTFGTSTTGASRTHNLNGFNAAAVYNFSKYFGAKVEFSGNNGSDTNHDLPGGTYQSLNGFTILVIPGESGIAAKQRDYKFIGGVQFKDNSTEKRLKPFAHALFGTSRQTTDFYNLDQQRTNLIGGSKKINANSLTMAFGGGLDVRVSKRIDIRVIQFDYNPVFVKQKTLVALNSRVDSLVTSFSGGSTVTALQSVEVPKHTQQNFRFGFGIVFH